MRLFSFLLLILGLFLADLGKAVELDTIHPPCTLSGDWEYFSGDLPLEEVQQKEKGISVPSAFGREKADSIGFEGVGWFRKEFVVADGVSEQDWAVLLEHYGASEFYLNGEKLNTFGKVSKDPNEEDIYYPTTEPFPISLAPSDTHQVLIRYSDHKLSEHDGFVGVRVKMDAWRSVTSNLKQKPLNLSVNTFIGTFLFTIGLVHLLLFLFFPRKLANLYFFSFSLVIFLGTLIPFVLTWGNDPVVRGWTISIGVVLVVLFLVNLHALIYSMLDRKFSWFLKGTLVWGGITVLSYILQFDSIFFPFLIVLTAAVLLDSLRVIVLGIHSGKEGSWILGSGGLIFISLQLAILGLMIQGGGSVHVGGFLGLLILLAFLSIHISMSLFLARDFAMTNKKLEFKLEEVQMLSEKNLKQEKEKQQILEEKKEELEEKVKERTAEVTHQKEQLEEKNEEIMDSIRYAKRIQEAILPPESFIQEHFPQSFILFKPRDIVSGDFYWFEPVTDEGREKLLFAAVDCTGHGVPGAFVSIMGHNGLDRAVNELGLRKPEAIMNNLNTFVRDNFSSDGQEGEVKDGMDMVLCSWDSEAQILEFAGANNPLYLVREEGKDQDDVDTVDLSDCRQLSANGKVLYEVRTDKHAIGEEVEGGFSGVRLRLFEGDGFHIFSDGYADQFGGPKGKKFKYKAFKQLLLELHDLPPEEQKAHLDKTIEEWRSESGQEQVDDICVIGGKI